MSPDLATDLVVQTLRTTNTLLRASRRLFRPLGLTEAQFNVLNVLARQPAGMTQRELGDILVVDRSNVTGLLDRLTRLGWVRREEMPDDRRAWRVVLTASGRRLWSRAQPQFAAAVDAVVATIGASRAREMLKNLRELEHAAEAIAAPGSATGDTP